MSVNRIPYDKTSKSAYFVERSRELKRNSLLQTNEMTGVLQIITNECYTLQSQKNIVKFNFDEPLNMEGIEAYARSHQTQILHIRSKNLESFTAKSELKIKIYIVPYLLLIEGYHTSPHDTCDKQFSILHPTDKFGSLNKLIRLIEQQATDCETIEWIQQSWMPKVIRMIRQKLQESHRFRGELAETDLTFYKESSLFRLSSLIHFVIEGTLYTMLCQDLSNELAMHELCESSAHSCDPRYMIDVLFNDGVIAMRPTQMEFTHCITQIIIQACKYFSSIESVGQALASEMFYLPNQIFDITRIGKHVISRFETNLLTSTRKHFVAIGQLIAPMGVFQGLAKTDVDSLIKDLLTADNIGKDIDYQIYDTLSNFVLMKRQIHAVLRDEKATFGMFSLSTLNLRIYLSDKASEVIERTHTLAAQHLKSAMEKLLEEYTVIKSRLAERPSSAEGYMDKELWTAQLPMELQSKQQIVEHMQRQCLKLNSSNRELPSNVQEILLKLIDCAVTSQRLWDHVAKVSDHEMSDFKKSHRRDAKLLEERIEIAKSKLLELVNEADMTGAAQMAANMRSFLEELDELENTAFAYNERERILGLPKAKYANFELLRNEITPIAQFWITQVSWDDILHQWTDRPLSGLFPDEMKRCIQFAQNKPLIDRVLSSKNKAISDLCRLLVKDIERLSRFYPLIEALHKIGCSEPTLRKLCAVLGTSVDCSLTAQMCVEMGLASKLSEIQNLQLQLIDEATYKNRIKAIDEFWSKQKLAVPETSDVTKLIKLDDGLNDRLADDMNALYAAKQLCTEESSLQSAAMWMNRLKTVNESSVLWNDCQVRSKEYLHLVQADTNLSASLNTLQRIWARINTVIRESDNFHVRVLIHPRVRKALRDCGNILDRIKPHVLKVVHQKAVDFARFLILPEQKLIQLFAMNIQQQCACEQINMCFHGVQKFIEKDNCVVALETPHGASMQLQAGCPLIGDLHVTWGSIEQSMQQTQRDYIKTAIKKYAQFQTDKSNLKWIINAIKSNEKDELTPVQTFLVAMRVIWTTALDRLETAEDARGLYNQIENVINECLVASEYNDQKTFVCSSLIVLRDITWSLAHSSTQPIQPNVLTICRWYEQDNAIIISVMGNSIEYGFEYYGSHPGILEGPLSNQFAASISSESIVLLVGKGVTACLDTCVKNACILFGKPYFEIDVLSVNYCDKLHRILKGAKSLGAWFLLSTMKDVINECIADRNQYSSLNNKFEINTDPSLTAISSKHTCFLVLNDCSKQNKLSYELKMSIRTISLCNTYYIRSIHNLLSQNISPNDIKLRHFAQMAEMHLVSGNLKEFSLSSPQLRERSKQDQTDHINRICKMNQIVFTDELCKIIQDIVHINSMSNRAIIIAGSSLFGKTTAIKAVIQFLNAIAAEQQQNPINLTQINLVDERLDLKDHSSRNVNAVGHVIQNAEDKIRQWYCIDGRIDIDLHCPLMDLVGPDRRICYGDMEVVRLKEDDKVVFETDYLFHMNPDLAGACHTVYLLEPSLSYEARIASLCELCSAKWSADINGISGYVRSTLDDTMLKMNALFSNERQVLIIYVVQCVLKGLDACFLSIQEQNAGGSIIDIPSSFGSAFFFSLAWAIHPLFSNHSNVTEFGTFLRTAYNAQNLKPVLEFSNIYNVYVDFDKSMWNPWTRDDLSYEVRMSKTSHDMLLHNSVTPTIHLAHLHLRQKDSVMLFGHEGSGKSTIVDKLSSCGHSVCVAKASPFIRASTFYDQLLSDPHTGKLHYKYAQLTNGKTCIFIDDLHVSPCSHKNYASIQDSLRMLIDGCPWRNEQGNTMNVDNVSFSALWTTYRQPADVVASNIRLFSRFVTIRCPNPSISELVDIITFKLRRPLDYEVNDIAERVAKLLVSILAAVSQGIMSSRHKTTDIPLISTTFIFKACEMLASSTEWQTDMESLNNVLWNTIFLSYGGLFTDPSRFREHISSSLVKSTFPTSENIVDKIILTSRTPDNPDLLSHTFIDSVNQYRYSMTEASKVFDLNYGHLPSVSTTDQVLRNVATIVSFLERRPSLLLLIGKTGSGRKTCAMLACSYLQIGIRFINASTNYFLDWIREVILNCFGRRKREVIFIQVDNIKDHRVFELLDYIAGLFEPLYRPGFYSSKELSTIESHAKIETMIDASHNDGFLDQYQEFLRNNISVLISTRLDASIMDDGVKLSTISRYNLVRFQQWSDATLSSMAQCVVDSLSVDSFADPSDLVQKLTSVHKVVVRITAELQPSGGSLEVPSTRFAIFLKTFANMATSQYLGYQNQLETLRNASHQISELQGSITKTNNIIKNIEPRLRKNRAALRGFNSTLEVQKSKLEIAQRDVIIEEARIREINSIIEDKQNSVQQQLDTVVPPLESAISELTWVSRNDLSLLRTIISPPQALASVMDCICALLNVQPIKAKGVMALRPHDRSERNWEASRRLLENPNFVRMLKDYDRDSVSPEAFKGLEAYVKSDHSKFNASTKVMKTGELLSNWVKCIHDYHLVMITTAPLKEDLARLASDLEVRVRKMETKQTRFVRLTNTVREFEKDVETHSQQVQLLSAEIEEHINDMNHNKKLAALMMPHFQNWTNLVRKIDNLASSVLESSATLAAIITYCTLSLPNLDFRNRVYKRIKQIFHSSAVRFPDDFNISQITGVPRQIVDAHTSRQWKYLPDGCVLAAVSCVLTSQWPLVIDPQNLVSPFLIQIFGYTTDKFMVVSMCDAEWMDKVESVLATHNMVCLLKDVRLHHLQSPEVYPLIHRHLSSTDEGLVIQVNPKSIACSPTAKLVTVVSDCINDLPFNSFVLDCRVGGSEFEKQWNHIARQIGDKGNDDSEMQTKIMQYRSDIDNLEQTIMSKFIHNDLERLTEVVSELALAKHELESLKSTDGDDNLADQNFELHSKRFVLLQSTRSRLILMFANRFDPAQLPDALNDDCLSCEINEEIITMIGPQLLQYLKFDEIQAFLLTVSLDLQIRMGMCDEDDVTRLLTLSLWDFSPIVSRVNASFPTKVPSLDRHLSDISATHNQTSPQTNSVQSLINLISASNSFLQISNYVMKTLGTNAEGLQRKMNEGVDNKEDMQWVNLTNASLKINMFYCMQICIAQFATPKNRRSFVILSLFAAVLKFINTLYDHTIFLVTDKDLAFWFSIYETLSECGVGENFNLFLESNSRAIVSVFDSTILKNIFLQSLLECVQNHVNKRVRDNEIISKISIAELVDLLELDKFEEDCIPVKNVVLTLRCKRMVDLVMQMRSQEEDSSNSLDEDFIDGLIKQIPTRIIIDVPKASEDIVYKLIVEQVQNFNHVISDITTTLSQLINKKIQHQEAWYILQVEKSLRLNKVPTSWALQTPNLMSEILEIWISDLTNQRDHLATYLSQFHTGSSPRVFHVPAFTQLQKLISTLITKLSLTAGIVDDGKVKFSVVTTNPMNVDNESSNRFILTGFELRNNERVFNGKIVKILEGLDKVDSLEMRLADDPDSNTVNVFRCPVVNEVCEGYLRGLLGFVNFTVDNDQLRETLKRSLTALVKQRRVFGNRASD